MAKRILKLVSRNLLGMPVSHPHPHIFTVEDIVWVMGSFCVLNRKPFGAELLVAQLPSPYSSDSFIRAARALGFRIERRNCDGKAIAGLNLPCLAVLYETESIDQSVYDQNGAEPSDLSATACKLLRAIALFRTLPLMKKYTFIVDIDWSLLPPVILDQCRLYTKKEIPFAFLTWAQVSDEIDLRLRSGVPRIAPHEWQSGPPTPLHPSGNSTK